MELLKLVPWDFVKPTKLLAGLGPYDYIAVDEKGVVLGRGRVKELILNTPGIFGYFNLREAYPIGDYPDAEAKAISKVPTFDEAPFGSLGDIQTIPGQPLIEPKVLNNETLLQALEEVKPLLKRDPSRVIVDEASEVTPQMFEHLAGKSPTDAVVKRDPLDHDGDGRKGGSVKGSRKRKTQ